MKTFAICAIAAVLMALPRSGRAEETVGVVAVAPTPGPTPALVDLTAQLRRAVAERVGGVLDPAQLRARMGDNAPGSSLSETNRMYEAARAAELSGDPQRAIVGLQAAIKELETFPETAEVFAQWLRAMLRLAKIESLLAGQEDQASETLERLLRTDPSVKLKPEVYGPDVVQLADSVRSKLAKLEKRRLTISSEAKGVSLQGLRLPGEAPRAAHLGRPGPEGSGDHARLHYTGDTPPGPGPRPGYVAARHDAHLQRSGFPPPRHARRREPRGRRRGQLSRRYGV